MIDPIDRGEVDVKLTAKGYYIWTIRLPILRTDVGPKDITRRLVDYDNELLKAFPKHPGETKSRFTKIDPSD